MANTLSYVDTVQRVGYTVIDGVKVLQHACVIPLNNPMKMRVSCTRLSPGLYEANRDVCRADLAAFEDAAYELRDACIVKTTTEEVE